MMPVGDIAAANIPAGSTHTYVITLGEVDAVAVSCADVTPQGSVSWGCDGDHFDEAALQASSTATLDLSPNANSQVTIQHAVTQDIGGRMHATMTLANTGGD